MTDVNEFDAWERESWEVRAQAYAGALGELTRGSIEPLLDSAGVGTGTRLLDVGSGPGFVALAAARRGAEVVAVDQSEQMVAIARRAGVDARTGRADVIPVPDGSADVLSAAYLLNHLAEPGTATTEFARCLCPGGRLAATVWDVPAVNRVIGLLGEITGELGLTATGPAGPDAARLADETNVRELLSGWDDVALTRLTWTLTIEPGSWFDALAAATPRAGAALSAATESDRLRARTQYVERARRQYGAADDLVALPAAAVLITATRP